MPSGKKRKNPGSQMFEPLPETLQLGTRVYHALLNSIVSGQIESGAPLRPDVIARQLDVSTTPVREAMHRLENDGLAVKLPYQGWFVPDLTEQQIRELYECRSALECFSVRLACQRIGDEEVAWLHRHHSTGEAALAAGDMDAYRIYNRDFHGAILKAASNSYLTSLMGQLRLQSEMLIARTVRIIGRPVRAIEEHHCLTGLIEKRDAEGAQRSMEHHILSALEDILRWGRESKEKPS
jgi:DNA-binding GntR family transcriptional regulator